MSTSEPHELLSQPYTQPESNQYGVIRIASEIIYHILPDIKIENCDTNGMLRKNGVFEALHKRLLLPESYVIHAVFIDRIFRYWNVLVESPDLPETEPTEDFPVVQLIHGLDADRGVYLQRIDVHTKEKMTVYPTLTECMQGENL